MAGEIVYLADERTGRYTPDALRIALAQSGFPGRLTDGGETLLLNEDKLALRLFIEDGWVAEIELEVTFVDDAGVKFSHRLENWLETMGWAPADDA